MEEELFPHDNDEQDGDPAVVASPDDSAKETDDEKPVFSTAATKRVFPCRVWHVAGSLSARLVNSEQEIRAMLAHGWTDQAPTPKQPEALGKAEHAKRIFPHR